MPSKHTYTEQNLRCDQLVVYITHLTLKNIQIQANQTSYVSKAVIIIIAKDATTGKAESTILLSQS